VATEQAPAGGLLVFVGADGARLADLTQPPAPTAAEAGSARVIDRQPAWSPAGDAIAFASSRGRAAPAQSSLWVVEPTPGSRPRSLTSGAATDTDPVWLPDGGSIVFSSNRSGTFDLWRMELVKEGGAWRAGAVTQVTDTPEHDVAPTVAPDGRRLAFERVDPASGERSVWRVDVAGGPARRLTRGPDDREPAWSPLGDRIVFAALGAGGDRDLVSVRPDGGGRSVVVADNVGDQHGPAFSTDGALLLASSVVRTKAGGAPIFSSLVAVSEGQGPALHALHDPVVVPRIGRAAVGRCGAAFSRSVAGLPRYTEALVLEALRDLCSDRDGDGRPRGCDQLRPRD